ncbi:hypothetical protein D7I46_10490 [Lactococcus allomyrinae]|uniref:Uncharacterized protein n=2 Tax=Lactococcus allomyrinae TaxID=2419773 RepID=A0A387BKB1_9LACT|nr:hypothetical protein D7I46_10490 [Lactococcus allomyrinae]
MRTLEEIETQFINIKKANEQEFKDYDDKVFEAQRELEEANKELSNAEATANLEAYKIAKDKIWTTKQSVEMYQNIKNKKVKNPLVSEEEYKTLTQEIIRAADAFNDKQMEQAKKLAEQLSELSAERNAMINKSNSLLSTLQRDFKKLEILEGTNSRVTHTADGGKTITSLPQVRVGYLDTKNLLNRALGGGK